MSKKWFKVTITDHDYDYTAYETCVEASSASQAIALGAALIGQEKHQREYADRSVQLGVPRHVSLLEPDVKAELCSLDEYWDKRDRVVVLDR